MKSRRFMQNEVLLPTDLVGMVVEIIPRLDLTDLELLLLHIEMEIDYRDTNETL